MNIVLIIPGISFFVDISQSRVWRHFWGIFFIKIDLKLQWMWSSWQSEYRLIQGLTSRLKYFLSLFNLLEVYEKFSFNRSCHIFNLAGHLHNFNKVKNDAQFKDKNFQKHSLSCSTYLHVNWPDVWEYLPPGLPSPPYTQGLNTSYKNVEK